MGGGVHLKILTEPNQEGEPSEKGLCLVSHFEFTGGPNLTMVNEDFVWFHETDFSFVFTG